MDEPFDVSALQCCLGLTPVDGRPAPDGAVDVVNGFCRHRYCIFREVFNYLFVRAGKEPTELQSGLQKELEMWRHHSGESAYNAHANYLEYCWNSLVQQAIRQDVALWLYYCAIRSDGRTAFICYPTYGSATSSFSPYVDQARLDVAMTNVAASRSRVLVSVAATNNQPGRALALIPGVHDKTKQWWSNMRLRGLCQDGVIADIRSEMLTRADKQVLGIGEDHWIEVPCESGDTVIMFDTMPRKETISSSGEKITFDPCYVGVNDDGSLEDMRFGTWESVAEKYALLIPPRELPRLLETTPISFPERFPAQAMIIANNPVAQALVGRRPWTDPLVVQERHRLLNGSCKVVTAAINAHREDMTRKMTAAYLALEEEEKAAYRSRAFFANPHLPPSTVPEFDPSKASLRDPVIGYQEIR